MEITNRYPWFTNSTTADYSLTSNIHHLNSSSFYGHHVIISILIVYLILGSIGNGLLMLYMLCKIKNISINDIQILNLALSDFLYLIAR